MADFKLHDNVGLKIPKQDRHSSDLQRIPCVIIGKSKGERPTFKLMCEFGVIDRHYDASNLMAYHGGVKKPKEVKSLSLREAARMFCGSSVLCKCRTSCSSNICCCFKAKLKCSSRCHKGKNEECQNILSEGVLLPKWGGSIAYQNRMVSFSNTCSLDSWIAILKAAALQHSFILKSNLITNELRKLFHLILANKFDQIKLDISLRNKITCQDGFFDLFDCEKNILLHLFSNEYEISSKCSSCFCPEPVVKRVASEFPSINSSEPVHEQLVDWFFESQGETICRGKMLKPTKDMNTHWDFQQSNGYLS